jgi:signal peptidase I
MSTPRSFVGGAITVAVLLAVAVLALPSSLGGTTGYVTTHGTSMEPRFHTGDLAVVRAGDDYRVGDVVAYHSNLLHTTVLHRIVAVRGGHYTFQGDNNSWIDPETPTEDLLIGKLVLRVPHGGVWLTRLTGPARLGLLALASLAVGGMTPAGFVKRARRKKKERRTVSQHRDRTRAQLPGGTLSPTTTYVTVAAAILGLLGLGLALFAWTGPVSRAVTVQQSSGRAVTFSYTAHVPPGPAYDDTTVTSPQPVFRALADSVDVRVQYQGEPGTVSVVAELATASGWRSTVPLAGSHRFDEPIYDGSVRLDLDALAERAERAAQVIGLPADQITVTVRPRFTDDSGNVFTPALPLTLTATDLSPADGASLHVEDSGTVPAMTPAARTLSLAGHELTARVARPAALVLLALALFLGGLAAAYSRLAPPLTEATTLRRYRHLLVPVAPFAVPPGRPVVDVTELATLAKLAERHGQLILHWSRDDAETFIVQDEGTSYRFRVAPLRHEGTHRTAGVTKDRDSGSSSTATVPSHRTRTGDHQ